MRPHIAAVLDTNVLVSALMSKDGIPAKVYNLIHVGCLLPHYCDEIIDEYIDVLNRPKLGISPSEVDDLVWLFVKRGQKVNPPKSSTLLPDEDDRIFYDTALLSSAILITGNHRHFPQEPFIMTPRNFYETLVVSGSGFDANHV